MLLGKAVGNPVHGYIDLNGRAPRHLPRLPFERRPQAEVVEHRRPQQQGHVAHNPNAILSQVPDTGDVALHLAHGGRRYGRAQIAEADEQRRQRLADFIVQLARNGGPLVLLRLHQPRGEFFQLAPRLFDFLVTRIRLPLQPQDPGHAQGSQKQPQPESGQYSADQPGAELGKQGRDLQVAVIELLLVDVGDLIGDVEHRHTAGEQLIAEKRIAPISPLLGVPGQGRLQNAPVIAQLAR